MHTSIRAAMAADISTLVVLMAEFYAESGYPLPVDRATAAFAMLIEQPALGTAYLIEAERRPAGYAVLTVSYSMEYGGLRGFIDDLFVRPPARQRGLATAALAEIRKDCQRRGVRALLVETGFDNVPAQAVYRRLGLRDSRRQLLSLALATPVHVSGGA